VHEEEGDKCAGAQRGALTSPLMRKRRLKDKAINETFPSKFKGRSTERILYKIMLKDFRGHAKGPEGELLGEEEGGHRRSGNINKHSPRRNRGERTWAREYIGGVIGGKKRKSWVVAQKNLSYKNQKK